MKINRYIGHKNQRVTSCFNARVRVCFVCVPSTATSYRKDEHTRKLLLFARSIGKKYTFLSFQFQE